MSKLGGVFDASTGVMMTPVTGETRSAAMEAMLSAEADDPHAAAMAEAMEAEAPARTFTFTFGASHTAKVWKDRRVVTWAELGDMLTNHAVGPKVGSCFVPATFRATRRHKADADQIDLVVLDADCGHTLEEIETAARARGWAAIVHSTHSHLTTRTTVKASAWTKFRSECPIDAERLFLVDKGYLPRVADGARVVNETADEVTFEHQPCPKFRVVLRLARPWRAADYPNQETANASWKGRIEALAGALGLSHDQSCTDTSRLFYLPRHPGDGREPVAAIVDGTDCDIWELPVASAPEGTGNLSGLFGNKKHKASDSAAYEFTDPETGECVDLRAWARSSAQTFESVAALKARKPEVFVGHVTNRTQHHIRCVNEDAHTTAGVDRATIIVNASEAKNAGFAYHCRHAHCTDHDRLYFVQLMLEKGWLKIEDLAADDEEQTDRKVRDRSRGATRIGVGIRRDGGTFEDLVEELRTNPETADWYAEKGQRDNQRECHRIWTKVAPKPSKSGLPIIYNSAGRLHIIASQAELAIVKSGKPVYQRGDWIVRPVINKVKASHGREATACGLGQIKIHGMLDTMAQTASWQRWDARNETWVADDPNGTVANIVLSRAGMWSFPRIAGVITTPTLRPDGTVLMDAGYDPATCLYHVSNCPGG